MRRLVERMAGIQTWITFGAISLITACVATQVFVRYVLQRPLFLWSEEVARFLLIWMVFLGIGIGVKNDAHFSMDILQSFLEKRWGAAVRLFNDLCMGLLLVLLVLAGLRFAWFGVFQTSPNLEIPMVWVLISIPIGGLAALLYLAERIRQRWRDFREGPR
jgi:TRAP-type C4-dicarboxylate transport system permease small subunit